jgi:CRP/FNR family transcriptional regulator, anaerobic regulatory protein
MTALRRAQGDKLNVMEKVISFLNNLHPLSDSLEAELRNTFRFTRKKKNDFLVYEGEVSHYAWYLQKGLVRCYYTRDEREVTTWFMEEDHVIVLFKSLFGQKQSLYNIQALEDCDLYAIQYQDIQRLYKKYPEVLLLRNTITELYSNLKDIKIRATNMLSPTERYRYFEKHFPHLLNRLKLEYIASYLDLSRRSLARARGL